MTDNLSRENTDLRAQLIARLEACLCPQQKYPGITVGSCVKRGECLCTADDLIKISQRIAS